MGKVGRNEILKIRARFFNNLSSGTAVVAITMMMAPFFFQSMWELSVKGILMAACPVVLLSILSWFWHLTAMEIASQIED